MKKFLLWAPRLFAIAFILFISLFALDAFEGDVPLWEKLLGFLIHLVPSFVLIGVLLIAWRFPLVGGLFFIGAGIFYVIAMPKVDLIAFLLISGPAFLTGGLFLAQHFIKD
jgi:hypothetical protein